MGTDLTHETSHIEWYRPATLDTWRGYQHRRTPVMTQPKRLLTGDETAARLRVHRDTLRRWARADPMVGPPPRRLGPQVIRYLETEVEAFIADTAAGSRS